MPWSTKASVGGDGSARRELYRRSGSPRRGRDATSCRLAISEQVADTRDDLRAVEVDVRHERVVGEASHPVFQIETGRAEVREVRRDLLGHGLRGPDVQRPL